MSHNALSISIIVPVYNNPGDLAECLAALTTCRYPGADIIVVDDASTDDTPTIPALFGARLLRLPQNAGPAAARNYGVSQASGDIVFFVDADVIVAPGSVAQVVQIFVEHPDVAAVFGSYDAQPRAAGIISQYRNLLHHFVHQHGQRHASTFWAGCGAIRRTIFTTLGGFDAQRFRVPSIEDIELGYRLRRAGHRILLDPTLQGTHLKRWTLSSVLRTDIFCRAIPWSRLLLETNITPDDLNLKKSQQCSSVLVGLAGVCLLLTVFQIQWLVLALLAGGGVIRLNRDLYGFFRQQRGVYFAAACLPLHWLYYLCGGLSYLYVWLSVRRAKLIKPWVQVP